MPKPSSTDDGEIVFVVDVSSFTKDGFIGSTTYQGAQVNLEFDDAGDGVYINSEMANRLHVRKGSPLTIVIEHDKNQVATATVAGIGKSLRISDPKVYYGVGKEGGAILRIRKG